MDLRATVPIPRFVPRLPNRIAVVWGIAYAIWGFTKVVGGFTPRYQCPPPPIAHLSGYVGMAECALGIATAMVDTRRWASLLGVALNLCLVGFAFGADARHLDYKGCGCFFGNLDLPWLPWHAVLAGALAIPFLAIFLDAERGRMRLVGGR